MRRFVRAFFGALLLASSAFSQTLFRLEKSSGAMGSVFSIALYGADREKLEAAAAAALDEARRLDALLSNYQPGSEGHRAHSSAPPTPVGLSVELFGLLCLPRLQPGQRRRLRHHRRSPHEGLGFLQ